LSALDGCIRDVDDRLAGSRLNDAAARVYDFFWNEFCDWYLELAKIRLYGDGDKRTVLAVALYVLGESVRLMHPFVPYVTEELWAALPMSSGLVVRAPYPVPNESFVDRDAEGQMELLRGLVTSARNIRSQYRVNPSARIELRVKTPSDDVSAVRGLSDGIKQLARVDRLTLGPHVRKDKGSASSPVGGYEVVVPLAGLTDLEAETERLKKERAKIERELAVVDKKLSNEDFVAKAREDIVSKAREKREVLRTELAKIEESFNIISEEL
jgi:valyl-tRNA synthetase